MSSPAPRNPFLRVGDIITTPENHFQERVMASPAPKDDFQVRVMGSPAPKNGF
jgi:hypothetical protein